MKTPQLLRLAQIDDQHFVMACGHGFIHLTWGRITIRISRDEFRRLGNLLERAIDDFSLASVSDQEMNLVYRADDASELRLGSIVLVLAPAEFQNLVELVRSALKQLDAFLAAGFWDRESPEDNYPHIWEESHRSPFSVN